MTGDRTLRAAPVMGRPPDSGRRTARQLFKELDGPGDEHFKRSLDWLSRGLGERVAQDAAKDPGAAAEARRAALEAYDLTRARRLRTALSATAAAIAGVGLGCLVAYIAASFESPPPRVIAGAEEAPRIEAPHVASAATAAAPPIAAAPPAVPEPAAVAAAPVAPPPLQYDEVRETQTRLRSFGFDPGPIDGAVGPMTRAAVTSYQRNRGLRQTGDVDHQLLEQLRADPAPQVVAPVVQRTPPRVRPSQPARQSQPIDPLSAAARDFDRWVQSLIR